MRANPVVCALLVVLALTACTAQAPPPGTDASPSAPELFLAFDEPPVLDKWFEPIYPEYAKQHQIEGLVQVRVTVSATGGVEEARVMDSSDRMFDEPTLAAARKWRFKPARKEGKKVRSVVMVPVKFSL